MNDASTKPEWKQKLHREFVEYWITATYLAIYFGVFVMYKRLILAQHEITYENYGFAIIKALILAKVILVGDFLRLGRGLEHRPLIFSTFYRAFMFTLWVALFMVIEHTVDGFLHGEGVAGGVQTLMHKGKDELLASCLVVFFTFIPFFAFRALGQVLGEGKIWDLFFRDRNTTG